MRWLLLRSLLEGPAVIDPPTPLDMLKGLIALVDRMG